MASRHQCLQPAIADLSELTRRRHNIPVGWEIAAGAFVAEDSMRSRGGARRILVLPTSACASYSRCRQYREDLAGPRRPA